MGRRLARVLPTIGTVLAVAVLGGCGSGDDVGVGDAARQAAAQPSGTGSLARTSAAQGQAPAPSATSPEGSAQYTTVTETQVVPFTTDTIMDASKPAGSTVIKTKGQNGTARLTYRVTVVGGVQTDRLLLRREIVTVPVTQVTVVGTGGAGSAGAGSQDCDPNYGDACVPVASDVDCEGSDGDGPAYVKGPVRVVGGDIYRLDSDGDGVGCE